MRSVHKEDAREQRQQGDVRADERRRLGPFHRILREKHATRDQLLAVG